jgi:integrase/recombinase XerD
MPAPTTLDRAVADFLTYLRAERGLSPATIRAYRGDLDDFASARGSADEWDRTPDAALRYLAARTRRGRPNDPGLAPTSLRRRAASIRGFYRFAFGEGLIRVDVAQHIDLPRQPRLLPETLTIDEVDRLLEAAPDLRGRALLELLYAAGLRISEALGLDVEQLSVDGAFVRVIGKGDRERLVPVGDLAHGGPAGAPRDRPRVAGSGRAAVHRRSRPPARSAARVRNRQGRRSDGGAERSDQPPHPSALVRHAPA